MGQQRQQQDNSDTTTEKLLPQNVEAEAAVLGSILINAETLYAVANILKPDDFYRDAHRAIYAAVLDLDAHGQGVDLLTVIDELARSGRLEQVEGSSYVSSLANNVPTHLNVESYAAIVARCATNRSLIHAAGQIAGIAYNDADGKEAILAAYAQINAIAVRGVGIANDSRPFGEVLDELFDEWTSVMEQGILPNLPTHLVELDAHMAGGLGRGELVDICGRPGSGKSTVAGTIAMNVAMEDCWEIERDESGAEIHAKQTGTVEWVTLEMKAAQQAKRLLSALAAVDGRIIRAGFRKADGTLDKETYNRVKQAANQARLRLDKTLRLLDRPLAISELRAHLTRAVELRSCKLAVIDYIGLLEADDRRAAEYERISTISRMLKQIALELNIPIVCLVQMNREAEKRQDKRPMLPDLRGSGGLEQDADWVFGVYRGAYYDNERAEHDDHFRQLLEIGVLKAREGVADVMIPLRFQGEYTSVSDWPAQWHVPEDDSRNGKGTTNGRGNGDETERWG